MAETRQIRQATWLLTSPTAARWNIAFLFGVIAAGGLIRPPVSVRLWSANRLRAVLVDVTRDSVLAINLSNSLSVLATGRSADTGGA